MILLLLANQNILALCLYNHVMNFYWQIMVKKSQSLIFLLIIFLTQISIASDDDVVKVDLHIKDHKFMPDIVELPTDKKVNITVYNDDPTIEEYVFHQPCGTWTASCKHGCGYKHLTSSSVSYRNKCCAGGRLSHGNSSNWNEAVDDWFTLDPLPQFMRPILSSPNFSNNSSSYNNLVAMIATKVDNYLPTSGWTRRGPGPASVFLNGRLIKMMLPASSTDQTGGLSYFVYDQLSSLATSPLASNVTPELLGSIITGLLDVNKYCRDLRMLGADARQNANDNNNLISTMPRQGEHFTVCSVVNNVQSGSITMQIQSRHSHQFSSVSMDSPLVETLSFPIIYLCGEPGWTNKDKHKLKLDQYVMARILRPEHDGYCTKYTTITD